MSFALPNQRRLRYQILAMLLAGGIPVFLIAPIASGILNRFDYPLHLHAVQNLAWPAHFLYSALLAALHEVTGDWLQSQRGLLFTNYGVLGVALYVFLARTTLARLADPLLALLAASLIFVYAIPALYVADGQLYKGYLALNVYHNSTSLLLKPIVVLHLLWLYEWMTGQRPVGYGFVAIGALLVILSGLAKPSYVIVLLPAVFFVVAKDRLAWRAAFFSVILPGIAVLAWSFMLTFGDGGGVEIAPFKVLAYYTATWTLLPKAVLSVIFPLVMSLLFRHAVMSDRLVVLCWLLLLMGVVYGVLLAEIGPRAFHGNWLWSGYVSAFALFVANTRLLISLPAGSLNLATWRLALGWLVFSCHLGAGAVWYVIQYQADPTRYW